MKKLYEDNNCYVCLLTGEECEKFIKFSNNSEECKRFFINEDNMLCLLTKEEYKDFIHYLEKTEEWKYNIGDDVFVRSKLVKIPISPDFKIYTPFGNIAFDYYSCLVEEYISNQIDPFAIHRVNIKGREVKNGKKVYSIFPYALKKPYGVNTAVDIFIEEDDIISKDNHVNAEIIKRLSDTCPEYDFIRKHATQLVNKLLTNTNEKIDYVEAILYIDNICDDIKCILDDLDLY